MSSDKMPYVIYADIKSLIEKIDGCTNIPANSSITKFGEHIPFRYSISIWEFNHIENKHTLYRRRDFMKKVSESLRENVNVTTYFEKKKKYR